MKKIIRNLALSAAIIAAGVSVVGCGDTKPSNTDQISTTDSENDINTTTETTTVIPTTTFIVKDFYDDITKTLKLKSYNSSSKFFVDGIEEVRLVTATDGDTAGFVGKNSGDSVTVRFYDVDTPESTGFVEKWGKSASLFTKDKLESAAAILLEGSETPPVVDSYGSRYLAYVWYKETADSEWKNLNLEIVENGYSASKALPADPYSSYFDEAQAFAKRVPLHIWSDDADPYFSEDASNVTVKELNQNFSSYYDSENEVGQKVRFDGYVSNVSVSSTQAYTYKVSAVEDDQIYTIDVYAGYNSTGIPDFFKIGNLYTITGTVQKHNGKFQVSGLTYVPLEEGGDYLTRLVRCYYMQFNSSVAYKSTIDKKALYKDAIVTAAKVEDGQLIITAKAVNTELYDKNDTTAAEEFIFYCEVEAGFTASTLVGKAFSVNGYQEEGNGSKQILVLHYSDFNFK